MSRQAYYKQQHKEFRAQLEQELIVQLVKDKRKVMPMVGGKKLYGMLYDDFQALPSRLGRDKFFVILKENNLLIKHKKKYMKTTNSHHRYWVYNNLIKDLTVVRANQVFVSDITYLRLAKGFCYLFLVTDVYSRKIVGYDLNLNLSMEGALKALKMALAGVSNLQESIHHSDRGVQYCSDEYIGLLKDHQIQISMSQNGNPYENAIAERINGILKTEFLLDSTFINFQQARKATQQAIETYNTLRPHMSLDYSTPAMKYAA